jgi:hypothetical protein
MQHYADFTTFLYSQRTLQRPNRTMLSIIRIMPRIARIITAGYSHHITQRGNNRTTVFFDDEDRASFPGFLQKA